MMAEDTSPWVCEKVPSGPRGFPFAVMNGSEVVAWVKSKEDAEFISRAREVVPRLVNEIVLLMSGIDNISNFVHTLEENLHSIDKEMKIRL